MAQHVMLAMLTPKHKYNIHVSHYLGNIQECCFCFFYSGVTQVTSYVIYPYMLLQWKLICVISSGLTNDTFIAERPNLAVLSSLLQEILELETQGGFNDGHCFMITNKNS